MTFQPEAKPGPWIAALRGSHERLKNLATPLAAEQLTSQSYDSEWSIAQVLSHIGSGAEIFGLFLAAARDGEEPPGRETFGQIWDRWNAKSPQDQATDALVTDGQLVAALESLDSGQLSRIRLTLMGMETDVAGMVRMRLSEHAIHTWDVEVALEPAAVIAPVPVSLLIDGLDQLVGYAGKPTGLYANVRVRTSDPDRDLALTIGDAVTLSEWAGGEPTAELSLPAEALLRLTTGRLDPDHTAALTITELDLSELRKVFPGF
jgi:uncharacterized protein (TIGR03083 family)